MKEVPPEFKIAKIIGAHIQQFRQDFGISQENLGERIGVDQNHISKIEHGKIIVNSLTLLALANALHVSLDDLVYGDQRSQVLQLLEKVIEQKGEEKKTTHIIKRRRAAPLLWTVSPFFFYL